MVIGVNIWFKKSTNQAARPRSITHTKRRVGRVVDRGGFQNTVRVQAGRSVGAGFRGCGILGVWRFIGVVSTVDWRLWGAFTVCGRQSTLTLGFMKRVITGV